jgi:hypothetical protein
LARLHHVALRSSPVGCHQPTNSHVAGVYRGCLVCSWGFAARCLKSNYALSILL